MRRGRRSFRTGSSSRRSVKWGGMHWYGRLVPLADWYSTVPSDVYTFWLRWPSGIADPSTAFNIPEEDTFIKSLNYLSVGMNNGGAQANYPCFAGFGLIAWDAIEPSLLDNTITAGSAPSPFDLNYDWIWTNFVGSDVENFVTGGGTQNGAESLFISKAQRKLPPGTGVLACCSLASARNAALLVNFEWSCRFAVKVEK